MCQKTALLHRLFVILHTPIEKCGAPLIASIQKPTPLSQAIYLQTQKEDRLLVAHEIERLGLPPRGRDSQHSIVELGILDDWLRRGGRLH